ncbi:hypothetical protein F4803DRAFT_567728 [Xylaria telfairii]|nr:hypothetical protein F4803DRAFT_567728 [Xylaria telfairii]
MAMPVDHQAMGPSSAAAVSPAPDRELLIADWIEKNKDLVARLDCLVGALSREVKPGRRSPETRANWLSFFEEVTAEEMQSYSPDQVKTILRQRENLSSVLSKQASGGPHDLQVYHPSGSYDGHRSTSPSGSGGPANAKPWVPHAKEECELQCCHPCRPSFAGRSFLSLNAIVNGDIPPTAATGFGFDAMGTWPVADARILRYIGLRPVPLPRRRDQSDSETSSCSSLSVIDLSDIVGDAFDDEKTEVEWEEDTACDSAPSTPSDSEATGFGEGPLEVCDGVAVLEESVELGVPDITTQVPKEESFTIPLVLAAAQLEMQAKLA